ncbi:MAG: ATP synthase subunit I [Desulfobacterales bacterium]|jgi:F1F0 ATPase subunit 2
MTINWLILLSVFGAGVGLGAFYFLGLWWTVRRLPTVRVPALWTVVSFVVRSVVALGGFYLVMAGGWQNLLACLAGFTLIRLWLVRRLSPASVKIRPGH